jgi:hypothetical protein
MQNWLLGFMYVQSHTHWQSMGPPTGPIHRQWLPPGHEHKDSFFFPFCCWSKNENSKLVYNITAIKWGGQMKRFRGTRTGALKIGRNQRSGRGRKKGGGNRTIIIKRRKPSHTHITRLVSVWRLNCCWKSVLNPAGCRFNGPRCEPTWTPESHVSGANGGKTWWWLATNKQDPPVYPLL